MHNGSTVPAEIENKLLVKPVSEMPRFEGQITEGQLEKFPEHDRPVLLAMSKIQQQGQFTHSELMQLANSIREVEIWLREFVESVKKGIMWLLGATIVGFLGALFLWAFKVI